ncbi:MAG: tRNA glutamyl-Q(34) synthetase GluQRS [Planctomycetaceae bacterium]
MNLSGRLAPSPTGAQHLGNARTYLLAWLSARTYGGRIVLRIEDIDSPRIKPWATDQAIEDLRWLGLDWDEGPDIGGRHAPYIQTQRTQFYDAALEQLIRSERAYPCTCTRTDIDAAASAPHEAVDGPIYPGTCASWRLGEALPPEGTYCWRFRCSSTPTTIYDRLRGDQSLNVAQKLGDFPLTRKNRQAAYQLAVVVDDQSMEINEVVRGDDLLPSAFRQADLQRALGYARVRYAHVPLVIGPDGRRLAKRHGDTRLSQYRDRGVRPEQVIGWAAYSAGLMQRYQPLMPPALLESFDWSRVNRDPVIVDSRSLAFV